MPTTVGRGTGRGFSIGHVNVPNEKKRAGRKSKRSNMRKGSRY